jgi:hypothetical protein
MQIADASKTNSGVSIATINDDLFLSYKLFDHNSIYKTSRGNPHSHSIF